MRYLGIDYGKRRVGIAISDSEGAIAFPRAVILNRGKRAVCRRLRSFIKKEKISRIVVGLPITLDGREAEQAKSTKDFVKILRRERFLPIEFENEMFTTRLVTQMGTAKKYTDAAAAAVILQSYLDKIHQG